MTRPRRSIVLLISLAIVAGGIVTALQLIKRHYDQRTRADYRKLSQTFSSIGFPNGYVFVSKSQQGSDYPSSFPFINSQAPTEYRVFRVRSRLVPTDITKALKAQGWTVENPFQCSFTARRQPHESLFVAYLPTPDPFPSSDSLGAVPAPSSGCPDGSWRGVYAFALLHLDAPAE